MTNRVPVTCRPLGNSPYPSPLRLLLLTCLYSTFILYPGALYQNVRDSCLKILVLSAISPTESVTSYLQLTAFIQSYWPFYPYRTLRCDAACFGSFSLASGVWKRHLNFTTSHPRIPRVPIIAFAPISIKSDYSLLHPWDRL